MAEIAVLSQVDQERLSAKAELRKYYRWRFGELPPETWQADHQVEQNIRFSEFFGTDYVHNIANLILVPGDVNADKNRRYQRQWRSVPRRYRELNAQVVCYTSDQGDAGIPPKGESPQIEEALVRDGLYQLIQRMNDPQAFSFLFEFSRDMLMDIIRFKEKGIWTSRPPQWLIDSPKWLDLLKDEVWFHNRYVGDYRAKFPVARSSAVPPPQRSFSNKTFLQAFGLSVLPRGYREEVLDY